MLFNPLEQDRSTVVSVYVSSPKAQVQSPSGETLEVQVSAVWDAEQAVSQTAYEVGGGEGS